MHLIALKMLWGDRAKYLGLIFGITFATLLMSQQVSIFIGIMKRAGSQIHDISEANIWVMHPEVQYIEEVKPLPDKDLLRVRSVPGVQWALPLFKGLAVARAPGGIMQQVIIMGVDDATLTGKPPKMMMGNWEDLRGAESTVIDWAGFNFLWPKQELDLGRTLEINDQRVRVVGICDASPPFLTFPVIYMRYSEALRIAPGERNRMSFVLAKSEPGENVVEVKERINKQTGLQALTADEFHKRSIMYYLQHTGIGINFGTTVLLGFIVGAAVAGQTFYIFIIENLRQFATLKAIGVTNRQILRMVFVQAAMATFIGFSIGIGLSAIFFSSLTDTIALRGFLLPWQVVIGTAFVIVLIILIASFTSIRKVMVLDPAIVFRG